MYLAVSVVTWYSSVSVSVSGECLFPQLICMLSKCEIKLLERAPFIL